MSFSCSQLPEGTCSSKEKSCGVNMLLRLYSAGGFYRIFCTLLLEVAKYKPQAPECAGFYKTAMNFGV